MHDMDCSHKRHRSCVIVTVVCTYLPPCLGCRASAEGRGPGQHCQPPAGHPRHAGRRLCPHRHHRGPSRVRREDRDEGQRRQVSQVSPELGTFRIFVIFFNNKN